MMLRRAEDKEAIARRNATAAIQRSNSNPDLSDEDRKKGNKNDPRWVTVDLSKKRKGQLLPFR